MFICSIVEHSWYMVCRHPSHNGNPYNGTLQFWRLKPFGNSNANAPADDHHQPKTKSAHRCRQIIIVFNLHWNGLMIPIPQYWLLVMSPLCHYEKVIVYPWHMDEIFVKSSTIKTPFHPGDESLWKWTKCSHPGIFFHNFQWPNYSMNIGLMCLEIIWQCVKTLYPWWTSK